MSTVEGDEDESKIANPDEIDSSSTYSSTKPKKDDKIVFLLKAAGGAPILKRKKWELPRTKTIGHIAEFLKKHLALDVQQQKQLILYVNQAFAPALDTTIGAVYDCFHSETQLVLHYSLTEAWG